MRFLSLKVFNCLFKLFLVWKIHNWCLKPSFGIIEAYFLSKSVVIAILFLFTVDSLKNFSTVFSSSVS